MLRCVLQGRRFSPLILLVLLAGALGTATPAAAQGEASAVITGVITDTGGGVLPGVTVTLRNVETGVARTAVSEGEGRYRLPGLLPGRYALLAELPGFANAEVTALTLTIGLVVQQNLTMAVQGVQEAVTVTGQAPIVETTTTEVAVVITQEQIESLPTFNRQAGSLALLLPGTGMPTGTRRARPTVGAGGSNANLTTSYVDGGLNQLYNSGQEFLEVPTSGIQEFKVHVSGASAQYGAVGGIVMTATKSGTNLFTGEVFEYFRDTSLNAFDKLEKQRHDQFGDPKPEYRRNNYGAALGGPIIRNRLHFFTAFERAKEPKTVTVETGQRRFYSAVEGNVPAGYERRQFLARGDFQLNNEQNVFARYLWDKEYTFCEECGGAVSGFSGTDTDSPRDSLLLAHTWVVSPRMLNEIRSQVPPSGLVNLGGPPGLPRWPASRRGEFPPERFQGYTPVYVFPSLSWGANGWSNNSTNRWDIYDDVTLSLGSHTLKFGGAYLQFRSHEEQAANLGTWTFDTDQLFDGTPATIANLRNPIQFTASFPPLPRYLKADWIQGYVHDEWRVRSNLTLDFGLRYENQYKSYNNHISLAGRESLSELIDPASRADNNNFGPRLGFAWDVRSDGRTVVRAATGKYYGITFVNTMRAEVVTLLQSSVVIRNPPYPDPYGGRTPASFVSTAPPNINITSDDIEQPESIAVNTGVSRELRSNLAVHVDGVFSKTSKANQIANINTPDPVTGQRPRPAWGRILQYRAGGEHDYRALYLRLDKRLSNRHQYLISYSLANEESRIAGGGTVTDFYRPELDRGPGDQERRHTLVASGAVQLPYDVVLGAVWSLRSSRPFSAFAGRDLNNDGATGTDYVPGTTRNMGNRGNNDEFLGLVNAWRTQNGRAPIPADQLATDTFNRFDVKVSKAISLAGNRRIEVVAQVLNLFGTDSYGIGATPWTQNVLSDSFGRINTVQPRQQAELGVKFVW